ncbi:MAG: excinuclease ABC subunit UvrC [Nitrospirota bacterium]
MRTDLSGVPHKPGVYMFRNERQKVLYVGKAKNLRKRLRSYFQKTPARDSRKNSMMQEVRDLSYIVTGNELEAFILEANLIKQHKPRFNIILRDDKNYPYLKLTVNEKWPRLEVVRKIARDGALYFGPYIPAGSMWETLSFIRRNFQIRDCRFPLDKPMRPCIQHQMGRCHAPCTGNISEEEYAKLTEEVKLFLRGEKKDLVDGLRQRMTRLAEEQNFEEAAKIRDRIRAIEKAWETQKIVAPELGDMDVIGHYREGGDVSFNVFIIRNGIMIGSREFFLKGTEDFSEKEIMRTFLMQFYAKEMIPPPEIVTRVIPAESKSLAAWLSQRRGMKVRITSPGYGKKKKLVGMSSDNAGFMHKARQEKNTEAVLHDLAGRLGISETPDDIGAFDVSNISGDEAVGAYVVWSGGDFQKERYRKLKIKTVRGIDDYAMMEEIIGRITDNLKGDLPDMILVDGGKGHLEVARRVLSRYAPSRNKAAEMVAVAKNPDRAYLAGYDEPVSLEDGKPSSLLLKSIRDEAHRFAVGFHRKLREKGLLQSPLEKIRGIGSKRRLELLRVFGSIEGIRQASAEDIAKLRGFHQKLAEDLLDELRRRR